MDKKYKNIREYEKDNKRSLPRVANRTSRIKGKSFESFIFNKLIDSLIYILPIIFIISIYTDELNIISEFSQNILYDEHAEKGIEELNEYRLANGRSAISFDKKLYDLAFYKSKFMMTENLN